MSITKSTRTAEEITKIINELDHQINEVEFWIFLNPKRKSFDKIFYPSSGEKILVGIDSVVKKQEDHLVTIKFLNNLKELRNKYFSELETK